MTSSIGKLAFSILFFIISFSLFFENVFAENVGNISVSVPIKVNESKIEEGDIISKTDKGFSLAKKIYDNNMYGVIVDQAPLELYSLDDESGVHAVSSGQALVRVSTKNGKIKVNDLITSSDTPGVGVRADQEGYVLGRAIEPYEKEGIGKITVQVEPHVKTENVGTQEDSWWKILLILFIALHF